MGEQRIRTDINTFIAQGVWSKVSSESLIARAHFSHSPVNPPDFHALCLEPGAAVDIEMDLQNLESGPGLLYTWTQERVWCQIRCEAVVIVKWSVIFVNSFKRLKIAYLYSINVFCLFFFLLFSPPCHPQYHMFACNILGTDREKCGIYLKSY